ncbi:MAG: amino acid permease [Proteobacteria bacterium]|nr:amino acid permease [Pseudomonadota bacterium]
MNNTGRDDQRTVGLLGATGVGVGAIVGGGIMVLAGVAFSNTGPAALVAFAINGLVALITAMSFAEMSSAFPESGGAYTFAKKVLSVRAAFAVGWVLWFAYIVAGVLYALGFAAFAVLAMQEALQALGSTPPAWLSGRRIVLLLATAATVMYAASLIRKNTGGGQWATIGKVTVFCIIIVVGLIALVRQPLGQTGDALVPFFSSGASGLLTAMGFTFIALQGFDLIAAIAGEVKSPGRTIPRAMFLSLGTALIIYLPLLFLVSAVGVEPGETITELSQREGDTVFARAVSQFMGPIGYWLVIVAAILSTLSALHANILAASRVALSMAHDRTLPAVLGRIHLARGTPVMAIYATALTLIAIVFMVPNIGAAGAAASLIFLISFALAHFMSYLARTRGGARRAEYRTPYFPLIPVAGGLACVALAIFQALVVPDAGGIVIIWLGLGVILYLALFQYKAETVDASAEAMDPSLVRLRGRNPLVLLPIANPAHARSLVDVANAMAPSQYARVLLLSIVSVPEDGSGDPLSKLADAQRVVREALTVSYAEGQAPEALITAAPDPWEEIRRIAEDHNCESVLLGLGEVGKGSPTLETEAENLLNSLDCDLAFMRAPMGWRLDRAKRILVPLGGRGSEHELRARLLGSMCRTMPREITFVTVLSPSASEAKATEALRNISGLAEVKVPGTPKVEIARSDDPVAAVLELARSSDLVVLGLQSARWGRKVFGDIALSVARDAACATIMLSSRRPRGYSELYRPLREVVNVIPWRGSDNEPDADDPDAREHNN